MTKYCEYMSMLEKTHPSTIGSAAAEGVVLAKNGNTGVHLTAPNDDLSETDWSWIRTAVLEVAPEIFLRAKELEEAELTRMKAEAYEDVITALTGDGYTVTAGD